jgi:hypothetical protein
MTEKLELELKRFILENKFEKFTESQVLKPQAGAVFYTVF